MNRIEAYNEKIDISLLVLFTIFLVAAGGSLGYSYVGFTSRSLNCTSLVNCILPLSLFVLIAKFYRKLKFGKTIFLVVAIVIVYWALLYVKYGGYSFLLGRLYDVIFSYILIRCVGIKRSLFYFEKTVTYLTLLSLFLWLPTALIPSLKSFLMSFFIPTPGDMGATQCATIGLYSISVSEGFILRNNGFAWEPGRFSSLVVTTLFLNMIRTRCSISDKGFIILMLGLLSSQSTTGYMTFIVCMILYLYNARKTIVAKILKIALPLSFILVFVYSSFMLDKILEVIDTDNFITENVLSWRASVGNNGYVPQRAEGLYYDFLNIVHDPLLGYGDNPSLSYLRTVLFPNFPISPSNGLLQIVAMLGIPLGICFYFCLYRSSILLSKIYRFRGSFLLFLLLCAINVSYNFFIEPLFVSFVFISLFASKRELLSYSPFQK